MGPVDPSRDLAGALHEVSNALTVVIGWIERARAEGSPLDVERALDVAADRASQARSIVRRAIGADVAAEPPALVALVLGDAVTGLEPELRRAGIAALPHVAPTVVNLTLDHAPTVLQILTNLLLNAIAMSPSGGAVRVEAVEGPRGNVVFSVSDEGPGVPPERRRTLFDGGVTTRAGGAGIGLRHAAALARSLGGTLTLVDSSRGARFELTWPVASTSTTLPPPPESRAQRLSALPGRVQLAGTRILLVEDDDAVVDLLDTALTARGADVVSIRHRRELARALATGPFDAALFDISPIQDDVQGAVAAVRTAQHAAEATRIVLISGSAAQMPEMPDAWIAAWVRKPFEIAEILHALSHDGGGSRPPPNPPECS